MKFNFKNKKLRNTKIEELRRIKEGDDKKWINQYLKK